jgi:hypothetical protein
VNATLYKLTLAPEMHHNEKLESSDLSDTLEIYKNNKMQRKITLKIGRVNAPLRTLTLSIDFGT